MAPGAGQAFRQPGSAQCMHWSLRISQARLSPRSCSLNLIKFSEHDLGDSLAWLMRKDQCMHCADPGCLKACPAPGAIVQYENGIVDVNPDKCIGCGMCQTGCPFDVPRFHEKTAKMSKCTLCIDRVEVGLEPACVKACPTGCLHYGTKDAMLELAKERVGQLK